ncbi:hypothetical protein N9D08_01450 [bacterium]|nr:hypothetical protein [bacterium]
MSDASTAFSSSPVDGLFLNATRAREIPMMNNAQQSFMRVS